MKICIIWKNDYPWDIRIEKIAVSLKEAGHNVFILCSNKNRLQREEIINGIKIYRLPFVNSNKLNSIISMPFYLNPFWLVFANRIIKNEGTDLIIVRDLPLILIGLIIKKKYNIPLILDMAEDYPSLYRFGIQKWDLNACKNFLIRNHYLIGYIEKFVVKKIDYNLVVIEESAKRLIEMGVNEAKISIVSNTPDLNIFRKKNIYYKEINKGKRLRLIYVGFVQEERGLGTVINSLNVIKKIGFLTEFVIIGNGNYLNQLKDLSHENQVEDMVKFKDWMKKTSIPQYIFESDIGVIPHTKTDHSDTTIPNKLFDFMACGKPVIVSNAEPMKRIVEEERCGLVFESGSVDSFVNAVTQLINNPSMAQEMGKRGLDAVSRRYNWEHDSLVLKEVIERFKTN